MDTPQEFLLFLVVIALLLVVPSLIAILTTKKLLQQKSKGVRVTGFVVVLLVSFVLETLTLYVGAAMTFRR